MEAIPDEKPSVLISASNLRKLTDWVTADEAWMPLSIREAVEEAESALERYTPTKEQA